jgi:hypothetical protein
MRSQRQRRAETEGEPLWAIQADERLDDGAHTVDADGDLVVRRKRHEHEAEQEGDEGLGIASALVIQHRLSTPLPDVGLQVRNTPHSVAGRACVLLHHRTSLQRSPSTMAWQVWRGALLAADYAVHTARRFEGTVVVELGAGTGLAGIALAAASTPRAVFITGNKAVQYSRSECLEPNTRLNESRSLGQTASQTGVTIPSRPPFCFRCLSLPHPSLQRSMSLAGGWLSTRFVASCSASVRTPSRRSVSVGA